MAEDPKGAARASAKKSAERSASEPFENMAAFNGAAMKVFAQSCQAYATGLAAWNGELMSFATARFRQDADLGTKLAKCSDWSEAVEAQQAWARSAVEDYFAEAGKLVEVAAKAAREGWKPVYEGAGTAFEQAKKPTN